MKTDNGRLEFLSNNPSRYRRHRGQIPLWSAIVLAVIFVIAVIAWTWHSTHGSSGDTRQEIVFWNAGIIDKDNIYALIHQFELANPQYRVTASTSVSPDVTGDAQRLLSSVAGGVPPDVVVFDRFAIGEWAGRAALTDLDPYLAAQKADDPYRIKLGDYYKFTLGRSTLSPAGHDWACGAVWHPDRCRHSPALQQRQPTEAGGPRRMSTVMPGRQKPGANCTRMRCC